MNNQSEGLFRCLLAGCQVAFIPKEISGSWVLSFSPNYEHKPLECCSVISSVILIGTCLGSGWSFSVFVSDYATALLTPRKHRHFPVPLCVFLAHSNLLVTDVDISVIFSLFFKEKSKNFKKIEPGSFYALGKMEENGKSQGHASI